MTRRRALTLGLIGATSAILPMTPAQAVQLFDNARVADFGLAELGTSRPTGWNQPGECIKSVQRWVTNAGGYFGGGGVISGYVNSGAQEVSLGSAVKGDVIQYTNGNGDDQDWSHVHTMVVINNHGNGRFDIVQSNSPAGSGLVTRADNIVPSPASGWVSRVWRFGTVQAAPSPFNNLQLSTVGTDGKVYTLGQTSPGTWSPNWAVINGNVKSASVTTTPDGLQHIAALGGDGNIYIVHQQANKQWGSWSQVQAQVTQVAIAATPEGKLHLAARGTNGKVYVLDEVNTGGPWSSNWTEINGNITSVAMVSTGNGKLHIASKGGDGNIHVVSQSATTGQWGSWSQEQAQVTQVAVTAA